MPRINYTVIVKIAQNLSDVMYMYRYARITKTVYGPVPEGYDTIDVYMHTVSNSEKFKETYLFHELALSLM